MFNIITLHLENGLSLLFYYRQYYSVNLYSCKMTDNPKIDTTRYLFSLIRLKPECKIVPTIVDFSPPFITISSTGSITPSYNNDRCYCTPAFILSSEKKAQERGFQSQKKQFEHRLREVLSTNSEHIIQDIPPLSNYCQICQEHFKDYDSHVNQKNHVLRWHHNEFNQDIQGLCLRQIEPQSPLSPQAKRKMIRKDIKPQLNNSLKFSPKSTMENHSKRKMSITCQSTFFLQQKSKSSLNL